MPILTPERFEEIAAANGLTMGPTDYAIDASDWRALLESHRALMAEVENWKARTSEADRLRDEDRALLQQAHADRIAAEARVRVLEEEMGRRVPSAKTTAERLPAPGDRLVLPDGREVLCVLAFCSNGSYSCRLDFQGGGFGWWYADQLREKPLTYIGISVEVSG